MASQQRFLRGWIAAMAAISSVLAGILGGWLTDRWRWGAGCAFLVLLGIMAIAEIIKARAEEPPENRTVSIPMGRQANISNSVISAGDVDQSRRTSIRIGAGALVAVATWAEQLVGHGTTLMRCPGSGMASLPEAGLPNLLPKAQL